MLVRFLVAGRRGWELPSALPHSACQPLSLPRMAGFQFAVQQPWCSGLLCAGLVCFMLMQLLWATAGLRRWRRHFPMLHRPQAALLRTVAVPVCDAAACGTPGCCAPGICAPGCGGLVVALVLQVAALRAAVLQEMLLQVAVGGPWYSKFNKIFLLPGEKVGSCKILVTAMSWS